MTKNQLRTKYLELRNQMSFNDYRKRSFAIKKQYEALITSQKKFRCIFIYLSAIEKKEPNTRELIEICFKNKSLIVTVPKLHNSLMQAVKISRDTTYTTSRWGWGIKEPLQGEVISPEQIDISIIPLLAYDLMGYRVGFGKGYYDRFLKRCKPTSLKVGLSFYPPEERIEDTTDLDTPLDICITPNRIYTFSKNYSG